jgi:hypothetical protein
VDFEMLRALLAEEPPEDRPSRPEICMFSSDYPHARAAGGDAPEAIRRRFYCDNFVDLTGSAASSLAA